MGKQKYINKPIEFTPGTETRRVYKPHRYFRYVLKEMETSPETMNSKNQVPESVPHEYVGKTIDGLDIYKQKLFNPRSSSIEIIKPSKSTIIDTTISSVNDIPQSINGESAVETLLQ